MSQVTAVPPDPDRRYSTLKGVGFALCGYFLFATADALTKTIVNSYSSFQIIPMQVVFASLPIGAVEATPFQRDLSRTHAERLATAIGDTGAFLDPVIAIPARTVTRYACAPRSRALSSSVRCGSIMLRR